jgi:hypothetical protein
MALPKLETMITVPTGGWSISVTEDPAATSSVTVAAGDYFLTSTAALLTALKTALDANATLAGTYTVTLDDTADSATGKVTISATGVTTFAITWSSTALRDALGFTGNTSAALTTTGASQSPNVFLPPVKCMPNMGGPDGSRGTPISDTTVTKSPSGTSKSIHYGFTYEHTIGFAMAIGSKVRTEYEVVTNESFQTFWVTGGMGQGVPFRYYVDRSDDATYRSWVAIGNAFPVMPALATWTSSAKAPFNIGPIPLIEYV